MEPVKPEILSPDELSPEHREAFEKLKAEITQW